MKQACRITNFPGSIPWCNCTKDLFIVIMALKVDGCFKCVLRGLTGLSKVLKECFKSKASAFYRLDTSFKFSWNPMQPFKKTWNNVYKLLIYTRSPFKNPLKQTSCYPLQLFLDETISVWLAGVPNRVRKWQCVSIPSYCPHTITNTGEEEVIIAWCY